jgi:hypothetical protein
MNYGSPLLKDQKKQKMPIAEEKELEKFKPERPLMSKSNARQLTGVTCDNQQILWVQRWMEQLVRERSLPPQLAGKEPFSALLQFLAPSDVLKILETLRVEFQTRFPFSTEKEKEEEEFDFLLGLGETLQHQQTSLISDHNTWKPDACD